MHLIVLEHQKKHTFNAPEDQNLLEFLRKRGLYIPAPCGGKGTCRKCQVEIEGLGPVLACQTWLSADLYLRAGKQPDEALTVVLPEPTLAQISADGLIPDFALSPQVFRGTVKLPKPSLADQRPDDERFAAASGIQVPFRLLERLPDVLAATDYQPTFYFRVAQGPKGQDGQEVLRFVDADSAEPLGAAFDIGTTTLAAWLYDLGSGQRLAAAAALNPQQAYGADVISRIDFASADPENRQTIKQCIIQAIMDMLEELSAKAAKKVKRDISVADICHIIFAGNTTMMHLLAGLPAGSIARAPFIPASRLGITLLAGELGLPAAPDTLCHLLPSVASYVGADITAGILACRLHQLPAQPRLQSALLLDIGTNGEIVLAGPQGLIACSTAAGPAFEGANIHCGMGGVTGAIDEFVWQNGQLSYTMINGAQKALGICGSGLVAALAVLLDLGLIESTGRIIDEPEKLPGYLASRIGEYGGQPAIILVDGAESATGEPIILTQKDIREVQNAKAAIAAGISLLISQAGLTPGRIGQVYLAGGFGNYLDVLHAFRIGMLPVELKGRTRAVGNSAGMGAILCLLEGESLLQAEKIARTVQYYELSADRRFVDLYVEAMLFPESEP